MEFHNVVKSRKSVREYSQKVIEKQLIEAIVDAGRLAATARNEQPWEFIVTQDWKKLGILAGLCQNGVFCKNANALITVFSKDTKYFIEDCSAATQNMLLAIESLGLGGCWIAGDKKDYADKVREFFGVPQGYKLVSMISIGYPKHAEKPHEKRELKDVLHWERW